MRRTLNVGSQERLAFVLTIKYVFIMLCKIDYEQSELKDYSETSSRAGHKYCRLVYVAADLSRTQRRLYGERNTRFIQIDSPRFNEDGSVDEKDEEAMIASFNKKEAANMWIERVPVKIPPTYMSSNGEMIVDAVGNPRVYTEISLPGIIKPHDVAPVDTIESIAARALRLREQRIEAGEWMAAEVGSEASPDVIDEIAPEPEPEPTPKPNPAFGAKRR